MTRTTKCRSCKLLQKQVEWHMDRVKKLEAMGLTDAATIGSLIGELETFKETVRGLCQLMPRPTRDG